MNRLQRNKPDEQITGYKGINLMNRLQRNKPDEQITGYKGIREGEVKQEGVYE